MWIKCNCLHHIIMHIVGSCKYGLFATPHNDKIIISWITSLRENSSHTCKLVVLLTTLITRLAPFQYTRKKVTKQYLHHFKQLHYNIKINYHMVILDSIKKISWKII